MLNFHDAAHANSRLSNCIVGILRDGAWITRYIESANKRKLVAGGKEYALNDPNIKYMFDELGYVNTRHQCLYLMRSPKRMWKAGITNNNLMFEYLFTAYRTPHDTVPFENCVKFLLENKYPDYRRAYLEVAAGRKAAVAFSPKFAVGLSDQTNRPVIYYRNKPIACVNEDKQVVMGDTNRFLLEQLTQYIPEEEFLI